MIYMKSTSGNDGSYNLTVSFAVGSTPDTDTVNVNNRLKPALPQLPQAVQLQGLTVIKRYAAILQFLNIYSEDGTLSPVFITSYATINVLDELSRVPGVGQALLFGKLNYSMRIWFDPQRLTSLNLSPSDVVNAIQAQNVQAPVGRIGARPVSNDQQFQLNVQTQGTLTTPEQFGRIVLRANPDGSVLRISDVARVEMGAQNEDTETRINGLPSVGVALYLAPDANAVQTATAVDRTLKRLSPRFPEDLRARVVYDSTVFVEDTIREVLWTVGEAFILVVIVVFLFLGSVRATIIPAVAVPVSLIGTFAFLLLAGYSANTLSLLAMGLAIGIVVDDAIVVVGGILGLARITPTSFLPEEDQGAFFLNIQLPEGASVSRTSETARQIERLLKTMPQVQDVFAVIGFSLLDGANSSNAGFMVAKLKPFEDRRGAADSAQALIQIGRAHV